MLGLMYDLALPGHWGLLTIPFQHIPELASVDGYCHAKLRLWQPMHHQRMGLLPQ